MQEISVVTKSFGDAVEVEQVGLMFKVVSSMKEYYPKLMEYIKSQGVEDESIMPYARYIEVDWEAEYNRGAFGNFIAMFTKKWHFFVGFQSSRPLEASNEILPHHYAEAKYLYFKHMGAYMNVGKSYKLMYAYAMENGIALEAESFEFYLNDPKVVKQEELETELYIPIKG